MATPKATKDFHNGANTDEMVGMEASRSIPIGLRVKLVLTPDKFMRVEELSSYSFQLVDAFTNSFGRVVV